MMETVMSQATLAVFGLRRRARVLKERPQAVKLCYLPPQRHHQFQT